MNGEHNHLCFESVIRNNWDLIITVTVLFLVVICFAFDTDK